jgi:hypothetical protein
VSAGVTYNCIPSLTPFHTSDARVRIVRGPVGSGKTTAMIAELLKVACTQAPDPRDKMRRTRMLVVRNTMPQLKQTCLESIMNFLRPIASWHPSDSTVKFRFGDVESDWLLLPLDRPQNIQRLLSLELTMAWISEAREVPVDIVKQVLSRCSRFPARQLAGGPTRWGMIMESNSFRIDSPWYEFLEEHLPGNWEYFVQPGARDPMADWLGLLDPDYYPELIETNTEAWVHQYVDNHYGDALDGQAVFRNSFKKEFHVSKYPLIPSFHHPLIVGLDFARHPAAAVLQGDATGRMNMLAELDSGGNMGIEKFTNELLYPLLLTERFRGIPMYAVGDPSGADRGQIGEESVFQALKRLGVPAFPASSNHINPRLRAVEKYLLQQRNGGPAFIIDPSCKVAIAGFQSRYRYKTKTSGQLDDTTPDKIRPWADIQDAIQYACLGTSQRIQTRAMVARTMQRFSAPVPVGAWT